MTPTELEKLDAHLIALAKPKLFADLLACRIGVGEYIATRLHLVAPLDEEVRHNLIVIHGNPFAPKPQGVLTGKTLFGKPIVEVENLLPEPVGEIVLVSIDAYVKAKLAGASRGCPQCGNVEIEATCIGCLNGPDTNKASCACGWRGEVRELAPVVVVKVQRDGEESLAPATHVQFEQGPINPFNSKVPTAEGILRYAPDGIYDDDPCTCERACVRPCKGQCGCRACANCYGDFLDGE